MKTFKAGKYYIGDPCYIFEKSWSDVCDSVIFKYEDEYKGKPLLIGSTSYGDGTYTDDQNRKYWVDSGTIGILPISFLKVDKKETIKSINKSEGMHIVEFENDFTASIENGIFMFGDIKIDTCSDDEDWDDEDDN